MRSHHVWIAIAAAGAAAGLAWTLGNDYYLRIFFMMCVYYLCAAGMNVLVGYAGQKSLGQAGLFAAGAYTAALATSAFDLRCADLATLAQGQRPLSCDGDPRLRHCRREDRHRVD
jgi:ABC-type branched-subunit amino acid transport system permease subunit